MGGEQRSTALHLQSDILPKLISRSVPFLQAPYLLGKFPSTIFAWEKNYPKELAKRNHDKVTEVEELPPKKCGHPLLSGVQLDDRVKLYAKEMRKKGVIINTRVVMAAAEGIVTHHDANLIADGGPIIITKHWARSLLTRMHFVKRRGNTKAKVSAPDFDQLKAQFVYDVKAIVQFAEITVVQQIGETHVHFWQKVSKLVPRGFRTC